MPGEPLEIFRDASAFFYDVAFLFVDAACRDDAAHAGYRIDLGAASDNGSGVEYGIAAYFHVIAEHSAEFL